MLILIEQRFDFRLLFFEPFESGIDLLLRLLNGDRFLRRNGRLARGFENRTFLHGFGDFALDEPRQFTGGGLHRLEAVGWLLGHHLQADCLEPFVEPATMRARFRRLFGHDLAQHRGESAFEGKAARAEFVKDHA